MFFLGLVIFCHSGMGGRDDVKFRSTTTIGGGGGEN